MSEFDPSEYTRAPVMSVSAGIALARGLVSAKPERLSRQVDKTAKKLEKVADEAQEVLALRQRAAGEGDESTRAVDGVADASWAGFRMRLEAWTLLPGSAQAERAGKLLVTLFGDQGLAFLRDRYPVQYTIADTILKRIDSDGLQAEIDALAGPAFLDNVRVQHKRYGDMLQGMWMRNRAKEEDLREHQRRLQRAITSYAIAVSATVDDDEPATADVARQALLPIANYRQQYLPSRGNGSSDDGSDEPADADLDMPTDLNASADSDADADSDPDAT